MRLVSIKDDVLINPENISDISVRIDTNPTAGRENDHGHDYPTLIVAMSSGNKYEIPSLGSWPNNSYPMEAFHFLISEIMGTR
jgi:hypothetical protein